VSGNLKMRKNFSRAKDMNHRRPIYVLPCGESLSDYDFSPSAEETAAAKQLAKNRKHAKRVLENLGHQLKQWERQDTEYQRTMTALRQKHIAAILVQAELDREWLARMNAWEQEINRRRNFYLTEHKKEVRAAHAAQLKKLEQIQNDIRKDNARAERQELLKRGLVKGRSK
jgi:hypothetical protein